jgi:hypothetical protein
MKFSAWSSLVISVCSAALVAPAALAGADVAPKRVTPGTQARLTFTVTNDTPVAINGVSITVPSDFVLGEAETKGSWKTEMRARTATWAGYRIAPNQFAVFALTVRVPKTKERALFAVLANGMNGRTETWQAEVEVTPTPPVRDDGARRLATVALIIAALAGLVALAGGLLALWLWLRPRPEPF